MALTSTSPPPEVAAAAHQIRLTTSETDSGLWLVDSGATTHCMSAAFFEEYEILRTYDFRPTLSNASNDSVEVLKVCDVRVRFGKQTVTLEQCLITNLPFNVLSPFMAYSRGWYTFLNNQPHMFQKKTKRRIKLLMKDRAWYATAVLPGLGKPAGPTAMELDVLKGSGKEDKLEGSAAKSPKEPKVFPETPERSQSIQERPENQSGCCEFVGVHAVFVSVAFFEACKPL